jgi:septal ring factor EnvC (AmiA/AmiB activator)
MPVAQLETRMRYEEFATRVRGLGEGLHLSDRELRQFFDDMDPSSGMVQRVDVDALLSELREDGGAAYRPPSMPRAEDMQAQLDAQAAQIDALSSQLRTAQSKLAAAPEDDSTELERMLEEMLANEVRALEKASEELEVQKRRSDNLESDLHEEKLRNADLLTQLKASQQAGAGGGGGKGGGGGGASSDSQLRTQLAKMEQSWRAALHDNRQMKKQKKKMEAEREREVALVQNAISEQTAIQTERDAAKREAKSLRGKLKKKEQEIQDLKAEVRGETPRPL